MRIIFLLMVLLMPDMAICFPVKNAEDCSNYRHESGETTVCFGEVIVGEQPFLIFFKENGDEVIMLPANDAALSIFKKNIGKKALIKYFKSNFFFSNDFSGAGPDQCEEAYFFESAKFIQ